MHIKIDRDFNLYRWLCLFFYRLWAPSDQNALGQKPVGIPGNRDPEAPCEAYAPRSYRAGDFQDCMTDGHYLCRGCVHIDPRAARQLDGLPPDDDEDTYAGQPAQA